MATLNALNAELNFSPITAFASPSQALPGEFGWLTTDPNHKIVASGAGFTYGGISNNVPTGGTVTSLTFDWVDKETVQGTVDAEITGISVNLTDLIDTSDPFAGQMRFWETVLGGNDEIIAPKLAGGRLFGDFDAVLAQGLSSVSKTGGDDVFTAQSELRPGLLLGRGDGGSPNALVGDAVSVDGSDHGMFASFADLTGGDDVFNLSGNPTFFTAGDALQVGALGSVAGGDDVINSSLRFISLVGFGRVAQYAGDVEVNGGVVTGGDDRITGSNFAFADEVLSGDVARNGEFGHAIGGADTLLGRAGQEMIAGDVTIIDGNGRVDGGADLIRGGGDSDILAGDVLMFDINTSFPVEAVVNGGADRIFGDAGDDWISGDVWEISNAAGTSQITGGADRLFGGEGDDQLFGDVGTEFVGFATADFLVGGDDLLDGGLGNDLLGGQGGSDTASFASLALGVSVNLQAGQATGQGTDTLVSIENATGSSKADVLLGSSVANRLSGGAGADRISGKAGADFIAGGAGADDLSGNGGQDTFDYNSLSDSGATASSRDVILDWDAADRIDVSTIDANATKAGNQAFAFDGTAAPGKGEIGLQAIAGGVIVLFNTDGDAEIEMMVEVVTGLPVSAADFVL